jgi:hypothetical protein
MQATDFDAPAEMFSNFRKGLRSRMPLKYKRFASLALAVQFAVEELDVDLNGISPRTESDDVAGVAIRALYDSEDYPLARKALRRAS